MSSHVTDSEIGVASVQLTELERIFRQVPVKVNVCNAAEAGAPPPIAISNPAKADVHLFITSPHCIKQLHYFMSETV